MALMTEKRRTKEYQEAFEALLNSLPKSNNEETSGKQKKQKVLGVKSVKHKRNKKRGR